MCQDFCDGFLCRWNELEAFHQCKISFSLALRVPRVDCGYFSPESNSTTTATLPWTLLNFSQVQTSLNNSFLAAVCRLSRIQASVPDNSCAWKDRFRSTLENQVGSQCLHPVAHASNQSWSNTNFDQTLSEVNIQSAWPTATACRSFLGNHTRSPEPSSQGTEFFYGNSMWRLGLLSSVGHTSQLVKTISVPAL